MGRKVNLHQPDVCFLMNGFLFFRARLVTDMQMSSFGEVLGFLIYFQSFLEVTSLDYYFLETRDLQMTLRTSFLLFFLLKPFLSVILFFFFLKGLLRELVKKYEVLLIIFFLVFLLFLISEGLLFVSFFWTSFHSLSSPTLRTCPPEGFYLPDPCELTFANTLLLSNAAISLGNTFASFGFTFIAAPM